MRALARQLDVELTMVTPSGTDGVITAADVQRVAKILTEVGPRQILRGVRRAMAQNMTLAQREVAAATVIDDADIEAWLPGADVTVRLVRALVAGCNAEPGLNAWFESRTLGRRVLKKIDVGVAVDLLHACLCQCCAMPQTAMRLIYAAVWTGCARISWRVGSHREEMRGNTITLSNFGMIGGKYSAPIVIPPTVAILGAGRIRQQVVAVSGVPAVHRVLPLSLTFDHRVVTGGEAARFLAAAIDDLTLAA